MRSALNDLIRSADLKRAESKERFESQNLNLCMLCRARGADKRSLFISCFYDLQEAIPEFIDLFDCGADVSNRGYYLRICKSCRAELIGLLRAWGERRKALRGRRKDHDGNLLDEDTEGLIPVRVDGVNVYMTPEQYKAQRKQWDEGK